MREIRRLQKGTENLIRRLPFQRLVREVSQDMASVALRFELAALLALQDAAEAFLIDRFSMCQMLAVRKTENVLQALLLHSLFFVLFFQFHAKRVTLQDKDMRLLDALLSFNTGTCGKFMPIPTSRIK